MYIFKLRNMLSELLYTIKNKKKIVYITSCQWYGGEDYLGVI